MDNLQGACTNRLLIEFQLLSDKKKVLHGRPWSFDRYLVCLKDFDGELSPNEVQFSSEPFWVQVHNLPFVGMTKILGEMIGAIIGKVHTMEVDAQGCGWGSFLRLKVDVDVTKPLKRGPMINLGGKPCWTYFKCEHLPNLCFKCGLLKHKYGGSPKVSFQGPAFREQSEEEGNMDTGNGQSQSAVEVEASSQKIPSCFKEPVTTQPFSSQTNQDSNLSSVQTCSPMSLSKDPLFLGIPVVPTKACPLPSGGAEKMSVT
ncbi:uncharacterized protein LOC121265854 [Juglans microcarpa x Juglans regia]|uniref:uncharacterized protein LOC121265854 n=1 Tax=Juglans microcarpa x Juglans regia TaxID=2249226 RepID=UPI001B7F2DB2|nr:uncharacterized protein LOC121265854 [Juglans microcarpa x Juglans regia]